MRHFLVTIGLTLILLIGLFNFAAPILTHDSKHYNAVHKTLYVDRYLSADSFDAIVLASIEWHEATHGIVTFDVKRLPQRNIDPDNSIIILDVTEDNPKIIELDSANDNSTLGYYDDSNRIESILLIVSRIDPEDFKGVVLHELGHALGLKHQTGAEGIGSLMYPSIDIGATSITPADLHQFCTLYDCKSSH